MGRRIIRFPLVLKDGKEARTLEEMQQHFDLNKVVEYWLEGKLAVWLEHRNYTELLGRVRQLDDCPDREEIPGRLCRLFGVEESGEADMAAMERRKHKLSRLRTYTDDEAILEQIDMVACSQQELEDILNRASVPATVYLCGEEPFVISDRHEQITYCGVNNPVIKMQADHSFDAKKKGIYFRQVALSSDSAINASFAPLEQIAVDDRKVRLQPMWNSHPAKIFKQGKANEVLVHGDWLICADTNMRTDDSFTIRKISTGEVVLRTSDFKGYFDGFSPDISVDALAIYEDNLACLVTEWYGRDGKLFIIDLESLEVNKVVQSPEGFDDNEYGFPRDYVSIYNGKISLFTKFPLGISCQYHDYDSGKAEGKKLVRFSESGTSEGHRQTYNGNLYYFSRGNKKMISDREEYRCKGFAMHNTKGKSLGLGGEIGVFAIANGVVLATGCDSPDSAVRPGYAAAYPLEGGEALQVFRAHDRPIEAIAGFDGGWVTVSEDGIAKVWDAETYQRLTILHLEKNPEASDIFDALSVFSFTRGRKMKFGATVDRKSGKLAIVYDRRILVYEE